MAVNKNNKDNKSTGAQFIDNLKIYTEGFSKQCLWTIKLIQLSKVVE